MVIQKNVFKQPLSHNISQHPHTEITEYVKKAVAGIEVRSSNYISEKYEAAMKVRTDKYSEIALQIRDTLLNDYSDVLEHPKRSKYITILQSITPETLSATSFRTPGWHSNERLEEANRLFEHLKDALEEVQKRKELSITVKNEDLQVVYKWIETFGIPHFYFQVFFDKVVGISFENILSIISDPENEDISFRTEKNRKNQDKPTIHINSSSSKVLASKVEEPEHESKRRELNRGQLLFYVTFKGGKAFLNISSFCEVLGINQNDF